MDSDHDDFGDELDDPVLAELLTELRAIADEPAPTVGPDLAAVIGGAVPLATSRTRRRAASALVLGLLSTGVLTGGISAAAADQLPAPVQRVVARVVNAMTPFEIPDRAVHVPIERAPDEEAPAQPGPTKRDDDTPPPDVDPSSSPPKSKSESGERTTDPGDEGGDESDHQSGGEDGDRSNDDRTRDEDRDRDDRNPDSEGSHSGDPDEQSGSGDSSGGSSGGGGGDDSDDDGVGSGDQED